MYRLGRFLGWTGTAPNKSESAQTQPKLRIGVLGAAGIAPLAMIYPAKLSSQAEVIAVAARDLNRATSFAKKHGIPKVFGSYEELIADPEVDAVYIPSPNGLHFKWIIKSLEAGKHVLCEKPIVANAEEAKEVAACAERTKKVVMEAAHSFYHPANIRAREIILSGDIGELKSVTTSFRIPLIPSSDIRYDVNGKQRHLAGGAFMDTGSYAGNAARYFTDLLFEECTAAKGVERFPGVDEHMEGEITFQNSSVKGRVISAMTNPFPFIPEIRAEVQGTKGSVVINNFVAPHIYHRIHVKYNDGRHARTETVYGTDGLGRSSYEYQLEAFVKIVQEQKEGGPSKCPQAGVVSDFVNGMQLLDGVYEKSGLGKRKGAGM